MAVTKIYQRNDGKSMADFLKGVNPAVYLFAATIIALVFANSPWSEYYFSFINTPEMVVWMPPWRKQSQTKKNIR